MRKKCTINIHTNNPFVREARQITRTANSKNSNVFILSVNGFGKLFSSSPSLTMHAVLGFFSFISDGDQRG